MTRKDVKRKLRAEHIRQFEDMRSAAQHEMATNPDKTDREIFATVKSLAERCNGIIDAADVLGVDIERARVDDFFVYLWRSEMTPKPAYTL